jgi:hypothetical protein
LVELKIYGAGFGSGPFYPNRKVDKKILCSHFSVLDNIIRRGFVWPNRFNFYLPIEAVQNLRDQTFAMPSPQGVVGK